MSNERKVRGTKAWLIAALVLVCTFIVFASTGCGGSGGGSAPSGADFKPPSEVEMPDDSMGSGSIDVTHATDGYFVVSYNSSSRLKFQVAKGEMVYNYDLPHDGAATVYPVNMGNGNYTLRIMKNTTENNYVEVDRQEIDVKLSSEYAPFLIPNQFCNYNDKSNCVAKARELTADCTNQGEAVRAVCDYMINNVTYDSGKARILTTTTGYIPDPDKTLAEGTGVCFDYASLGAAMLRSIGFPTKIITGYVSPGDLYHAWIMVYVDGSWQTGEFSVNPETWSRVDLTFAASGSSEFTGDGTSYTERYVY